METKTKYQKYRESNLKNKREYYKVNREKILAYQSEYRAKNKKRIAERDKVYRQLHKEDLRLGTRARHAKIRGQVIKEQIINWHTRICGICDELIDKQFEYDHIIPLSKGGTHETANVQLAHRYCNRSKKDRTNFKINKTALADGLFVD